MGVERDRRQIEDPSTMEEGIKEVPAPPGNYENNLKSR